MARSNPRFPIYFSTFSAERYAAARERNEGRRTRVDTFIEQYFAAREVVNRPKERFGQDIVVDVRFNEYDGPKRTSSTLSDFIRNASSWDNKRVYGDVLKKAARSQAE